VKGVTALLEVQAIATATVTTHGHKEMIKTVIGDVAGKASVPEVLENMIKFLTYNCMYIDFLIDQYLHLSLHFQIYPHYIYGSSGDVATLPLITLHSICKSLVIWQI
jgi:hypothetical protein